MRNLRVDNGSKTRVLSFEFSKDRTTWLLLNGFVDCGDVWKHPFTQEVAGLFDKGDERTFNVCTKRAQKKTSVWQGVFHGTKSA